jgi:hypothetical protein
MLKDMDEAIELGQTNKANAIANDLKDINDKIRMTYTRSLLLMVFRKI